MSTLVSNKLREHLIAQFIESISEPANNVYYMVASKHTPYTDGDLTVPQPGESVDELEIKFYEEAIFGKKINSTDVYPMIPKYVWTSNTVYDHYDHEDINLFDKQFYVAVDGGSNYFVYKCLDNNLGAASTEAPLSVSESACNFITTGDGYTWKLMYKLPEDVFEKFVTNDLMPVATSANVAGNTVAGAIDIIRITDPGTGFVANLDGQFQADDLRELIPTYTGNNTTYRLATNASSNSDFYVGSAIYLTSGTGQGQLRRIVDYVATSRVAVINSAFTVPPSSDTTYQIAPCVLIFGDGDGAAAYASVSSNSSVNNFISKINIVNRGSNYTFAYAAVTGNTGSVDKIYSTNGVIDEVVTNIYSPCQVKPIIPPVGGHGHDSLSELGSHHICISTSFNTSESGYVTTENDFRKVFLLKDPLFTNVYIGLTDEVGTFTNNETVYQINYKTLTGTVSGSDTSADLTGVSTQLDKSLKVNDYVLITDISSNTSCLRTVEGITSNTEITLNSNLSFVTSSAKISYVEILASAYKSGNVSPSITLSNAEPKFTMGGQLVGANSGAMAVIDTIDVNEKNYNNWNTFDNRVRIVYTGHSGTIPEDSMVFQEYYGIETGGNAYFHSANSTHVFLTSEQGVINADPDQPLFQYGGSNSYTLGSVKYPSDIIKGSGKALYIENNDPISRSPSQSETIRIVLKL